MVHSCIVTGCKNNSYDPKCAGMTWHRVTSKIDVIKNHFSSENYRTVLISDMGVNLRTMALLLKRKREWCCFYYQWMHLWLWLTKSRQLWIYSAMILDKKHSTTGLREAIFRTPNVWTNIRNNVFLYFLLSQICCLSLLIVISLIL